MPRLHSDDDRCEAALDVLTFVTGACARDYALLTDKTARRDDLWKGLTAGAAARLLGRRWFCRPCVLESSSALKDGCEVLRLPAVRRVNCLS